MTIGYISPHLDSNRSKLAAAESLFTMPRTMQFFENTYPADADGVLDQLPAFDEEVHRYYDLRQADRPVDAFSDQVATISQQDVHQTLLDKAAAQGFRLDQ